MAQVYGGPLSGDPFTDRRRTGIGGSDAGAILGVSPWGSALSVWEEKRGIRQDDWDPPERVIWGSRLERAILDGYAEDYNVNVKRTGRKHRRSKRYPFVVGHPDGETDDRLLEVKTTAHQGEEWGLDGSEDVPAHYYAQVQHYMVLTEHERADMVVLVGGREMHRYTIPANPAFQDAMLAEEAALWQKVIDGTPPDPDGSESAGRALRRMFPMAIPEEIVATPAMAQAADDYLAAKRVRDEAEASMRQATQMMQSFMGSRERLVGSGWSAKWSNVAGRTSWKDAAEGIASRWRDLLIPHYSDDALDDIQRDIEAKATAQAKGDTTRRFALTTERKDTR